MVVLDYRMFVSRSVATQFPAEARTAALPHLQLGFSVSHTTRAPRPGEEQGVHYHFATRASMSEQIARGEFLEHAEVHGNLYGTSVAAVASVLEAGKSCILDIDVQGSRMVHASALHSRALYIFVSPPSMEVRPQPAPSCQVCSFACGLPSVV